MLLKELMESVLNSQSALDQLISNANQMYVLYIDVLPDRINNLYARGEHEDMFKTSKTVVGRAKGTWFAENYFSTSTRRKLPVAGMKQAMATLSKDPKYNVEGLSALATFEIHGNKEKQAAVASSGSQYVTQLEMLPHIMLKLATRAPDQLKDRLTISANRLRKAVDSFYDLWGKLQDRWDAEWGDKTSSEADINRTAKKAEKSNTGSQNSQVEMIVAQVLGSLDKRVAAEIRPIVARSDDKLMTLQLELQKRNIKM